MLIHTSLIGNWVDFDILLLIFSDKRAFFLVSTSSFGPQIYELVAATVTERTKYGLCVACSAHDLNVF